MSEALADVGEHWQTAGLMPRFADVNGVRLRYVQFGHGPLVLMLHGFPEYLHSWRAQLPVLAAAGYTAVAVDLRGYGGSSAPADPRAYSHLHLAGDVIGLMDRLGYREAIIVGHDMGAHLAWALATLVPERIAGVAALSVPLRARDDRPPLEIARQNLGPDFYQLRFQTLGAPENDLDLHVDTFLPGIFDGLSGEAQHPVASLVVPPGTAFSELFPAPNVELSWLPARDLAAYVDTFRSAGFAGPVHWYRNIDVNWELTAAWASEQVTVPSLYLAGDRDIAFVGAARTGALERLATVAPGLVDSISFPGCGHWTNQERPEEINAALVAFCDRLPRPRS